MAEEVGSWKGELWRKGRSRNEGRHIAGLLSVIEVPCCEVCWEWLSGMGGGLDVVVEIDGA